MKGKFLFYFILLFIGACGVKGDPRPPQAGPNIGRGKPTFKRAARELKLENQRYQKQNYEEDEENESTDEEQN